MKEYFTTFEVGDICNVYHTTVINWINKGQLKAFVTPGGHRRIHKQDLVDFLTAFQMPIPPGLLHSPKKKVLLVDDDTALLTLLKRGFSDHGEVIDVASTHSGIDALMQIGRDKPQLAIIDIVMPDMNGIEVCRRLKSNPDTKDIALIAMSGELLMQDQEKYLREIIDAFFQKPFSVEEMIDRTFQLLGLEAIPYETQKK